MRRNVARALFYQATVGLRPQNANILSDLDCPASMNLPKSKVFGVTGSRKKADNTGEVGDWNGAGKKILDLSLSLVGPPLSDLIPYPEICNHVCSTSPG